MKKSTLLVVLLCLCSMNLFAFEVKESKLTVEDLAAFLGLRHKAFTLEEKGFIQAVSWRVCIYQDGKILEDPHWQTATTGGIEGYKEDFTVVFQEKKESVDVMLKYDGNVKGSGALRIQVEKPEGVTFPMTMSNASFDENGRLVLALNPVKNTSGTEGSSVFAADKDGTPEAAAAALVFEVKVERKLDQ
jgi:hypothetical protein